jgi:D-alanine--poly(phosphoribitol) ligase subunit 2
VRENAELPLFELALLDSLKVVELMVAYSETFGIEVSPAEFDRDQWATPGRIVAYIERRVGS